MLAMDAAAETPKPRTLEEIEKRYAQDYFEVSRVCERALISSCD